MVSRLWKEDRADLWHGILRFLESDQLPAYTSALLQAYGEWYQPERNGDRGRYPARRRKPCPGLLYAQVVKRRVKGRVVEVTRQLVFGDSVPAT